MIFRDLLNVLPTDVNTVIHLTYYSTDSDVSGNLEIVESREEHLVINFEADINQFDLMIAEHFADDDVLEIAVKYGAMTVVVDRTIHDETMQRWKEKADRIIRSREEC